MLRRAMGKKIKAEMDHQRAQFVDGAVERGLGKAKADEIFDLLAKFADYGFNKSHAAAYALVAYQTAWCKANYPVEFLAASMTLDKSNTDKLAEFRNEATRLGVRVEPPSINRSGVDFEVHREPSGELAIRYALSAVKGVGEGQAEALVKARGAKRFRDLSDLAARLNPREVNKKVLEALAAAGGFDELERDRARVFAAVEPILALANRAQEESQLGQTALFGAAEPEALRLTNYENWSAEERLRREFEAMAFFISGHPLDAYQNVMKRLRVEVWARFAKQVKQGASAGRLAATVLDRAERRTKSGSKMGIVTLSDPSGQYEAILFQEGLNQHRDLSKKAPACWSRFRPMSRGKTCAPGSRRWRSSTRRRRASRKACASCCATRRPAAPFGTAERPAGRRSHPGLAAGGPRARGRHPAPRPLSRQSSGLQHVQGDPRRGGGGAGLAARIQPPVLVAGVYSHHAAVTQGIW